MRYLMEIFIGLENKKKQNKMKVLHVHGDGDYAAVHFETEHGGKSVDEIIANPDKFLPTEENDEYEQWNLEVLEFEGVIDPKFLEFARYDMRSYDDTKHENYYVEGEIVGSR